MFAHSIVRVNKTIVIQRGRIRRSLGCLANVTRFECTVYSEKLIGHLVVSLEG